MQGTQENSKVNIPDWNSRFSLKEILFKYLSHLPLFIFSLVICVGAGLLFIRYKVPIYKVTAKMLIKSDQDRSGAVVGQGADLINTALFGAKSVNIDNELELIKSPVIYDRIVAKYQLNVYYTNLGKIKNSDIYKSGLFDVDFFTIPDSLATYTILTKEINPYGGRFELIVNNSANKNTVSFKWNDTIKIGNLQLRLKKRLAIVGPTNEPFMIIWVPLRQAVNEIAGKISVAPVGKTSVIEIVMQTDNPRRGEDILNYLIAEYRQMNIEDKNKINQNTVRFIDDRLIYITKELSDVEGDLKKYRRSNKLYDIDAQAKQSFATITEQNKLINELEVKLAVIRLIESYLKEPANNKGLIPSNLSIEDLALKDMINNYNILQMSRDRAESSTTQKGFIQAGLMEQISNARNNILESLINIKKAIQLSIDAANKEITKNNLDIAAIPEEEKKLLEIKRQQNVKEGLFLFLLQKREEAAISSASTISNYESIGKAVASATPFEPKVANIRTFSFLIGLIIPLAIIYLMDLLNDKITTRDDITKRLKIPIAGEISHIDTGETLVSDSRNISAEQFRILRSNLQFLLPDKVTKPKVILVTSSISGEGKSVVSLNLAFVLSLSEKKVALLEFDLRKASRLKELNTPQQNSKGLTNYLIGQVNDLSSIYVGLDKYPNLHIFNCGPIPPNPAELMMNERVPSLFEWLKQNYDYIILDTAPVGLVSDSFSLVGYSDIVLYIIRQRFTYKKQLELIDEIQHSGKLKNMSLVVNDVRMGGKYGYYGYSYGYGYGYNYGLFSRYGYGKYNRGRYGNYGYGNTYFDNHSKKGKQG